jgi:hypothetical protein
LRVVPSGRVARAVEQERAAVKKKARKEEMEAARMERLENLRAKTTDRRAPRWMAPGGRWSWRVWDQQQDTFVDTGIEPEPGRPLAQQRPPGH